MKEYIIIGTLVLSSYLLFTWLRYRYFNKMRYFGIMVNIVSIILFSILFFDVYNKSLSNMNYAAVLLMFLVLYFFYNIYKELVRLRLLRRTPANRR